MGLGVGDVIEGVGDGVGRGAAGFSIVDVEGVGRGVGDDLGVVGEGAVGIGVPVGWVVGWVVGFGLFRLLLGLRCFLVRGVGVVLEETLSGRVFVSVGL